MTITWTERLGTWIEANPRKILLIAILMTLLSFNYAQQIQSASGIPTLVDVDSRPYQEYDNLYVERFSTENIVVLVEGEDVLTPDVLRAMDRLSSLMKETKNVEGVKSIADVVMDAEEQETGVRQIPDSQEEIYRILGNINPLVLKPVMIDESHLMMTVSVPDYIDDLSTEEVAADLKSAVAMAEFPPGPAIIITGNPPMNIAIKYSISADFSRLLGIAIILMAVTLFILYRDLKRRVLPLTIVLIGTIWTFGAMGFLNIPMTLTSMAAFPVLLGLGINYTIQFRNRIEEEIAEGKTKGEAIVPTIIYMAPPAAIVMSLALAGFIGLKFSTVPMIKDFGKLCVIGLIMCFLMTLFVGVTAMGRAARDKPTGKTEGGDNGGRDILGRILARAVDLSVRAGPVMLIAAFIIASMGLHFDGRVLVESDDKEFVSQDLPELVSFRHLTKLTGGTEKINVIVQADDVTDPAVLKWMDDFGAYEVENRKQILSATSIATLVKISNSGRIPESREEVMAVLERIPQSSRDMYISGDDTALIDLGLGNAPDNLYSEGVDALKKGIDRDIAWLDPPPAVSVIQTGFVVVKAPVFLAIAETRPLLTLMGLIAIYLILVLIYRNPIKALLPALPALVVIGAMGITMYFGGINYTPLSATFLGAMILGISSGYAVFVMERFYKEKGRREDPVEALKATYKKTGFALAASGMATIFGFSALISSPFPLISSFGMVVVLAVFFALIVTFIVFPALLIWLDGPQVQMAANLALGG